MISEVSRVPLSPGYIKGEGGGSDPLCPPSAKENIRKYFPRSYSNLSSHSSQKARLRVFLDSPAGRFEL